MMPAPAPAVLKKSLRVKSFIVSSFGDSSG
jgi:hypothetical protein